MITYWDTSAAVPLLIRETTTEACQLLWSESTMRLTTRLLFVEAAAALHQARRLGRLDERQVESSLAGLGTMWRRFRIIELDELLMADAASVAGRHSLRGYDAVHCAAGLAVGQDPECFLVSGDQKLLAAWRSSGAAIADISRIN